ncbi:MAG: RsmD family RNA methyltransferase, partial [Moraxellaceae bacterium]
TCLDALAGSGALGFEALSRGAARVVMIERHAPQRQALQAAATALAAEGATVLGGDALALVATPGEWCPPAGFDGVFLDPPYQAGLLPGMVARLLAPGWLKPGAFVYVEADVDWPALGLPTSLVLEKQTRAGAVHAMLVRYRPA